MNYNSFNSLTTNLPLQRRQHIFTHLPPMARHSDSDELTPVKGEDIFNISCHIFLLLCEMRWISHNCNSMLAFNTDPLCSLFSQIKKKCQFVLLKKAFQVPVQISSWKPGYTQRYNNQFSYNVHVSTR